MQPGHTIPTLLDINADLGEGMPTDGDIMPWISSANIACGYHAGSYDTMLTTLAHCRSHGIAAGAHPSFLDRENFGRIPMQVPAALLTEWLEAQLASFLQACTATGNTLHHVKLHGALYNMAAQDAALAHTVLDVLQACCPGVYVYGLAGSVYLQLARERGFAVVHEFFADRSYTATGALVPRSHPQASLTTLDQVAAQVEAIVVNGQIPVLNGTPIDVSLLTQGAPMTICVHGDGPQAVPFVRTIVHTLQQHHVTIGPPPPAA